MRPLHLPLLLPPSFALHFCITHQPSARSADIPYLSTSLLKCIFLFFSLSSAASSTRQSFHSSRRHPSRTSSISQQTNLVTCHRFLRHDSKNTTLPSSRNTVVQSFNPDMQRSRDCMSVVQKTQNEVPHSVDISIFRCTLIRQDVSLEEEEDTVD